MLEFASQGTLISGWAEQMRCQWPVVLVGINEEKNEEKESEVRKVIVQMKPGKERTSTRSREWETVE